MKTLLARFDKEILNYIIIDNFETIADTKIKIEKLSFSSADSQWEKNHNLVEELTALLKSLWIERVVFHSAASFMWKINEVRYAQESFLQYVCFKENILVHAINKANWYKILGIKKKEFLEMIEDKKSDLVSKKIITKSNVILEGLVLIFLLRGRLR